MLLFSLKQTVFRLKLKSALSCPCGDIWQEVLLKSEEGPARAEGQWGSPHADTSSLISTWRQWQTGYQNVSARPWERSSFCKDYPRVAEFGFIINSKYMYAHGII